ncbi:MAG: hypothetical protein A4E60_00636 [Syntrophorhabdus sp. PtaB.Bin047]|jgi:hypothetical protein|nr:MAG: hypothetical protein A4E60_00636 [Syntrophorhabdus sp. PtaB.Bin047]
MKPKSGYCIGCTNKHGCKSRTPPCIDEMTSRNVSSDSGKQYLIDHNMIELCRDCPFLRSCWTMEEYKRRTA